MHTRFGEQSLSPSSLNAWITRSQQKINLGVPAHRRRHRQARTRMVVWLVALAVVAALAVRWAGRMWI